MDIFEKAFEVFGNKLPERHLYSATVAKPATVLQIKKQFGSYKEFVKQYNIFIIEKRNKEAKAAVVTKPASKEKMVTKPVSKEKKVTKVTK